LEEEKALAKVTKSTHGINNHCPSDHDKIMISDVFGEGRPCKVRKQKSEAPKPNHERQQNHSRAHPVAKDKEH